MTNAIQNFDFNGSAVRVITKDGQPWWVAADVCSILELTNPTVAIAELDEDERAKYYLGRQGEGNIVSEAGLYSLILRSRKPEAKAFKRWVTHEVLPTIRKTGGYSLPGTYLEALEALVNTEKARLALAEENTKQAQIIRELKPKADYTDSILRNRGLVTITQIAKDYGMSGLVIISPLKLNKNLKAYID